MSFDGNASYSSTSTTTSGLSISTEFHASLYFDEIEKLVSAADADAPKNNPPDSAQDMSSADNTNKNQPLIVGKLQDRLLQKHLQALGLRRVVSHNTMSTIKEDVGKVNSAADGTRKMHSVLSFSDIRHELRQQQQQQATSLPLSMGEIEEETSNAVFDEFMVSRAVQPSSLSSATANPYTSTTSTTSTLPPYPNKMIIMAKMGTPTSGFFIPPAVPSGQLQCTNTTASAASSAGRSLLALPSATTATTTTTTTPATIGIPKPASGPLRRARTDAPSSPTGAVSVEEFTTLLRQNSLRQI